MSNVVVESRSRKRKGSGSSSESDQNWLSRISDGVRKRLRFTPSGFFQGARNTVINNSNFLAFSGGHNIVNIYTAPDPSEVLNKLPHVARAGYQSDSHSPCLENTRTAELHRIEEWELYDGPGAKLVYWLTGMSGCGKTTIARTFAKRSDAARRLGASFFCSHEFEDRRDIRRIIPTLAYSLADHSPEFKTALLQTLKENPDVGKDVLVIQFEKLLVGPLKSITKPVTIVIDALDECDDKDLAWLLLSLLDKFIDSIPHVKFFIAGRPEIRIRTGFRLPLLQSHTEVFRLHEVELESVEQDIELYLRTRLSEIIRLRSHQNLTVPWPTDEDIIISVKKCSGLFIVASVIVEFVSHDHLEPQEQLKIITSEPDSTVQEGRLKMDQMYDKVLVESLKSMNEGDTRVFVRLRLVIGSIVVVFNPLSLASLTAILDVTMPDLKTPRVETILRCLHSIFVIPDLESEQIRLCHKSLADYLTNEERCKDERFYIDRAVLHSQLAVGCLRLINDSLKIDIFKPPSYATSADMVGLEGLRDGLEYGCKSWAMHLCRGLTDGDNVEDAVDCLRVFFEHHLLTWLEVLSIVGDLRCAVYSLQNVMTWLVEIRSTDTRLLAFVEDSRRFVLQFFDVIESSATHIYESALPWSPSWSLVRAQYRDQMSKKVWFSIIDETWDASTRAIQSQQDVESIVFSHKDDLIAVGEAHGVEIFEVATGQRRAAFTTAEEVFSLAFSPDDLLLAAGDIKGVVYVWDLPTESLVCALKEHTGIVFAVNFSPCGSMLASSSRDWTIKIWDASTLGVRRVLRGHSNDVSTVCWSGTGREVISGSRDTTVKLWSVSDMTCSRTFNVHDGAVSCVASFPNSTLVASSSQDGTVKVFNVETGDVLRVHTILIETLSRMSLRFLNPDQVMYTTAAGPSPDASSTDETSTDGPRVAGIFVIWDFKEGADKLTVECGVHYNAGISSDGTHVASSRGAVVKIWQTRGITPSGNKNHDDHTGYIFSVPFSSDGQWIASASDDHTVKIWNTSTGKCLTTFRGHSRQVLKASFSPDSRRCASWGIDAHIRIWDIHTGNEVFTLGGCKDTVHSLCFSPSGDHLLSVRCPSVGKFVVEFWEITTRDLLASMDVQSDLKYYNTSFDVDGRTILMEFAGETRRWTLSPAPLHDESFESHATSEQGTEQSTSQDTQLDIIHPPRYRHDRRTSWILDEEKRRILWVPLDLRQTSSVYMNKVAFGSTSGRVTIVEFLD